MKRENCPHCKKPMLDYGTVTAVHGNYHPTIFSYTVFCPKCNYHYSMSSMRTSRKGYFVERWNKIARAIGRGL